jgi:hypothetical protein
MALQVKSARGNEMCQIMIALAALHQQRNVSDLSVKAELYGVCVRRTDPLIQSLK